MEGGRWRVGGREREREIEKDKGERRKGGR